MKNIKRACAALLAAMLLSSMAYAAEPAVTFDFEKDDAGFTPVFADYPAEDGVDDFYELRHGWAELPMGGGKGLFLSGNNHSDDLFMGYYKELPGLKPGRLYEFHVTFRLATNVDGGMIGELNYECFHAASASITVTGKNVHPGSAKGIMKNAIKLAYEFMNALPDECPENTEGYEGFYHVENIKGTVEEAAAEYLIRDHDKYKFEERKELFVKTADKLNQKYGTEIFHVKICDTYSNMREMIEKDMRIVDRLIEAMKCVGVEPEISPIRGGTDGARLSFEGLLCPNICTGTEGSHSRNEFACIEDMEKVVEILINLVKV